MAKVLVIGIKGMALHVLFNSLAELCRYEVFGIARNIEASDVDRQHKVFIQSYTSIINKVTWNKA